MTPEILLPLQFEDMVVRPPNHDEMVSTMKSDEPPEAPSCAQQFSVPVMTSNTAPQVSTVYQNVSKLMRQGVNSIEPILLDLFYNLIPDMPPPPFPTPLICSNTSLGVECKEPNQPWPSPEDQPIIHRQPLPSSYISPASTSSLINLKLCINGGPFALPTPQK